MRREDYSLQTECYGTVRIEIHETRKLESSLCPLFQSAVTAFAAGGSLGYRATRAAGAWKVVRKNGVETVQSLDAWRAFFDNCGIETAVVSQNGKPVACGSWEEAVKLLEVTLKSGLRKKFSAGKKGNQPSPLGSAKPRQRSAVRLRPLCFDEVFYAAAIYTPRVLGKESQDPSFKLKGLKFSPDPEQATQFQLV